jgi:transcriptional regulator with XRE-family HTH domain
MEAAVDQGRKQPNGRKIVELRKQRGLKQEVLAERAKISVRLLRDIEKKNYAVRMTDITAIANVLNVDPSDITLSGPAASPTKPGSPSKQLGSLLKLRAVRSATELSGLAEESGNYEWSLKIDPIPATAADMQAVMKIVHRLVKKYGRLNPGSNFSDEFDEHQFGEIPRLAHLQDLLSKLLTNGVNVVAGTYTYSSVRKLDEGEDLEPGEIRVGVPRTATKQAFKYRSVLRIQFMSSDVEEDVISIHTGPSLEDFEVDDDDIPF